MPRLRNSVRRADHQVPLPNEFLQAWHEIYGRSASMSSGVPNQITGEYAYRVLPPAQPLSRNSVVTDESKSFLPGASGCSAGVRLAQDSTPFVVTKYFASILGRSQEGIERGDFRYFKNSCTT